MGIVENLKALVPVKGVPKSTKDWDSEIVAIRQKRDAAAQRVTNNAAERDAVILDATRGDAEAQARLDRTNADVYGLTLQVENLDRAIATAQRHRDEAEAKEAREAITFQVNRAAKAHRDMIEAGKNVVVAARDLLKALGLVLEAAGRLRAIFEEAKARHTSYETRGLDDRLAPNAVIDVFVRWAGSIGLGKLLGMPERHLLHDGQAPDFVDALRAAGKYHELRPDGRIRVASPHEPLDAA